MPHHPCPIDSSVSRRRSPSPRRVSAWLLAGLAVVALGACGSGDESAAPPAETLIDAVTGKPVEAPEDFTLTFEPPAEGAEDTADADETPVDEPGDGEPHDDGAQEPEQDPDPAGQAPADGDGSEDGAAHPLETVIIDTVAVDPEAIPVLDEAAALACANTEFAMDALIEGAPDLTERFAAAAEWAAESAHQPTRAFAERLAAAPTGAEANDLVVAVLEACASAGYEL